MIGRVLGNSLSSTALAIPRRVMMYNMSESEVRLIAFSCVPIFTRRYYLV